MDCHKIVHNGKVQYFAGRYFVTYMDITTAVNSLSVNREVLSRVPRVHIAARKMSWFSGANKSPQAYDSFRSYYRVTYWR